jgi:peptide chain release factor
VARLTDRLERDAARRRVAVTRVDAVAGERPGTFRSVLLRIADDAYAASWTGTLCWQANAMRRLRSLLATRDEAAARSPESARWEIHDDLVRGDPVRTFTPASRRGS